MFEFILFTPSLRGWLEAPVLQMQASERERSALDARSLVCLWVFWSAFSAESYVKWYFGIIKVVCVSYVKSHTQVNSKFVEYIKSGQMTIESLIRFMYFCTNTIIIFNRLPQLTE